MFLRPYEHTTTAPKRILFAGDVWPGWLAGASRWDLLPFLVRGYGPAEAGVLSLARKCASGLRDALKEPYHFVANCEGVLSSQGTRAEKKKYTLRAHPRFALLFRGIGISHVSMANNHCLDYGLPGIESTCEALRRQGITPFGLSGSPLVPQSALVRCDGRQVVLLAFVERNIIDPSPDPYFAYPVHPCPLDESRVLEDISGVASRGHAPVAVIHWGLEWTHLESKAQRSLAHKIIDAGACAVVGHHSHLACGVEHYRGGVIAYGLGNLLMGLPPLSGSRAQFRPLLELKVGSGGSVEDRILPLHDHCGFPSLDGGWNDLSLRCGYWPPWFPARGSVLLDSCAELENATVARESVGRSEPLDWYNEHSCSEELMNGRLVFGPGWKSATVRNTASCRSREFAGREFLEVNHTCCPPGCSVSTDFECRFPVQKLFLVYGEPTWLELSCAVARPRVEILFNSRLLRLPGELEPAPSWAVMEFPDLSSAPGPSSIQVRVTSPAQAHAALYWRILAV